MSAKHDEETRNRQSFLRVCVLVLFFGAYTANAEFQSSQPTPSPPCQSPGAKRGLDFRVGPRGLDSLSYDGQSLLGSPQGGDLQPWKSPFRAVLDVLFPPTSSASPAPARGANAVDLVYPWGHVSCTYGKHGDKITMRIDVSNAGTKNVDEFSLRLIELNFPSAAKGGTLEAGMFAFGFKGPEWPLTQGPASIPSVADPKFVVPLIHVDYRTGALDFCSDDLESSVDVPGSTSSGTATSYPFVVTCRDIKPGTSKMFNVSMRFGPAGTRVQQLSGDILERYAARYPLQVNWKDHRPIGAIFLAGPQINVATNPRRWTMNFGEIDVTNDKGKAAFRAALLKLAENSIQVLKDIGAQGMITWDPEGEEFGGYCYYGDPRLVPTLAPEMEFKNSAESAIDEYFAKFRAAGLKVGVCVRPQEIKMVDGKPIHQAADDERAAQILRERIAYAKQRWGCTLFYVDSTATVSGAIDPNVFKAVADAYPDILLIPENESMRYFAYSAPLNSYQHHKITATPTGARLVYPNAFSVLMAAEGDRPEDHDAMVDAVRHGDILLFNAWYGGKEAGKIKRLYEEAAR